MTCLCRSDRVAGSAQAKLARTALGHPKLEFGELNLALSRRIVVIEFIGPVVPPWCPCPVPAACAPVVPGIDGAGRVPCPRVVPPRVSYAPRWGGS